MQTEFGEISLFVITIFRYKNGLIYMFHAAFPMKHLRIFQPLLAWGQPPSITSTPQMPFYA